MRSGLRFTHLHIMCPYLNASEVEYARSHIDVSLTTTRDVYDEVRLILDDYLFDVLEQEMGLRAEIFIGSPRTTYSSTVIMQKVYQGKGQVFLFSTNPNQAPLQVTKSNVQYFDR